MFNRVLFLIQKEILAVLRDRKSRTILIIPPIVQLLIFAFAATLDVQNVTMGILNRDNGKQAFELVQRFHGSPTFSKIIYLDSVSAIAPFMDNQEGVFVLSIDEQFSRNLEAGKRANIQVIFDGRKSNTSQVVSGYVLSIVEQFNREYAAKAGISLQNSDLVVRNWFNPNLIYYWMNVPNLSGILTMLIALMLTALSIARERELGTFDQLLVSPLLPVEIIIGKTVPSIIISMLEGSFIIFVAVFIFGIPFTGSIFLLYFSMLVFVSSIVGVGLFISALCSTQQQAVLGSYFFMSPAVLLSGFATPVENMPDWLQVVTYFNPLRYYLVIAQGIFLKAMPFKIVFMNTWPMALMAIFTLIGAGLFTRKKLG